MKKQIVSVALSAVAVMSIVGAVSAQDTPPATPVPPDRAQGVPPLRGQGRGAGQPGAPVLRELLQIVAGDLSMEPQAVVQALRGQTLADVIAANSGDLTKITADVTAAVTERVNQAVTDGNLTQERADAILGNLDAAIQSALNGELRELRPGSNGNGNRPGQGGLRGALQGDALPLINAAADATGLTAREIADAIRGGQTLSEVITANSADPAAVESAALATVKAKLDEAVTNGRLTEAQETAMLDGLKAFYDAALTGAFRPAQTPARDGATV